MRARGMIARIWAELSILLVLAVILFLFVFVFIQGGSVITWDFLSQPPSGAVLGEEGGILPAITGSLAFTLTATVLGGVPAIATALFLVFFCKSRRLNAVMHTILQCISGIPSIVLGLFAYSFFVRDLNWGRCVLSASMALGIMILPFIEVHAEKAFREIPRGFVESSQALGCSPFYTIFHVVLPSCRGELISGVILGACYAMGATAPMIFTGAVAFATSPTSLMQPAMALPLHLYLLIAQGTTSLDRAYGTAFVMMALILVSNLLVMIYSERSHRRWTQR